MSCQTILDVQLNKLIPLEIGGTNAPNSSCFTINLSGSALVNDYPVFFDTGSWSTNIPYSMVNRDEVTVIKSNTRNGWKNGSGEYCLCDLVSGTITLKSSDGSVAYTLENFQFYALYEGQKIKGHYDAIVGGFPSIQKRNNMESLTYALAQKYEGTSGKGVGIMSAKCDGRNSAGLTNVKTYLKLGLDDSFENQLYWRSKITMFPNFGGKGFSPEAVGFFDVSFQLKSGKVSDSRDESLIATVDTGASELAVILEHIIQDHPNEFDANHYLKPGRGVYINFTDDFNQTTSYSYTTSNEMYATKVMPLTNDFYGPPLNRFCLGNSIYWNCYAYFWDLTNERVGLRFFCSIEPVIKDAILKSGQTLQPGEKIVSSNEIYYLKMQEDGNLCLKKTAGDVYVWCMTGDAKKIKKGTICTMQSDGNLNVSANGKWIWSAFSQASQLTKGSYLKLTNDGIIQIKAPDGTVKWQKP